MILDVQIKLILFSFIYGIFLAGILDLSSKYIYNKKRLVKIIFTSIYVFINVILYFGILQIINYGILHYYSFLAIIIGYMLENYIKIKINKNTR